MRSHTDKNFQNNKKTYLAKLDKSKKGFIDAKAQSIISTINKKGNYYTTSSCSGRVYFHRSAGKKNETEWINISHDLINNSFFTIENTTSQIWLRYEGFILHVACKDAEAANSLLKVAQTVYKKSSILTMNKKIIVEIRSSTVIEMPFYLDNTPLFAGDQQWLLDHLNTKLKENWDTIQKLEEKIKKI